MSYIYAQKVHGERSVFREEFSDMSSNAEKEEAHTPNQARVFLSPRSSSPVS